MTEFSDAVDAFLDALFRIDPLRATAAGMHAHDSAWPDLSEAGRLARLAFVAEWDGRFAAFPANALSPDDAIDRDLIRMELAAAQFAETELREETWSPLAWVYVLGDGLFSLLAREFAPLGERLASVASRLEGFPAILAAAREQLVGHAGRPIAKLHTETALRQLAGIVELIDDAQSQAADSTDDAVAAVRPRLDRAAEGARAVLGELETFIRDDLLPLAEGDGRLGPELFAAKLRHTLRSDLTPAQVLTRAEGEYAAVRAEMVRLSRLAWPQFVPERSLPSAASEGSEDAAVAATVRTVLDRVALEHQPAGELLSFCRAELARIEAFVRTHDLIGLADEPLEIRWTPVFLRAFGGAMLDSPGPLDKGEKSFFSITPIPDDWSAEQAESYLREDNDRMLRLLTIHEAVPGHYLQGVYANRVPSIARTIFWSGVFAEGWAVYVTQVMVDVGYEADDLGLLLNHWKFYLRAVINAIIDVKIHTAGMTEDEAVRLMVDGGFQEESEARNKWNRARLTSTQLSTYFVGSLEMWDIELEARRRAAERAGAPGGRAAIADPALPGGFGDTPGFAYRPHLEAVIAHGAPPTSLLRRILFD